MHNLKRRAIGSLMAVMMGTTTILGSTPVLAAGSYTYGDFVCGTGAIAEAEQSAQDITQVNAANDYGLVSATEGNILHAWDWKFTDVTKSMKDIAEAGYSLVQVSPCQVCEDASTNNDWWKLYQPYDYKFGNSLGSADEFKDMCATAKEYGISIIVDVVANHMAGTGTGACGERKAEVDSWWTDDKFHNTNVKFTGDYDDNRDMMVRSNIGMPDIDTGRDDVQQRMVSYLESMLDMGAGGFRYDAAKHIGTTSDTGSSKDTFWKTISDAVSAKKPDALVYGEILNSMPVSDQYYVNDGIKVTESQKGWDMKDLVQGGASKVTDKTAFTYTRTASANNLITWVENHDTYLNHWGSTGLQGHANYMSDEQIMLAWSTVGARADAQALYFARPDGCSKPSGCGCDSGNCSKGDDSNKIDGTLGISTRNFDWKDKKVAAVNKFKNAMVGVGETTSTKDGLAIIQRGNKGLVVTNYDRNSKNFEVSGLTGLQDGTYEDASGQNGSFTVSGGKVSGSVKGNTFVVLYDTNTTTPATTVPATETPATEIPVGGADISVSKDNGTFDAAFNATITVKNAEYAYYSNDGADWTEITNGTATVKIGDGATNNGDTYALYVKAKGEDGKTVDVTKTYTYSTGSADVGNTYAMKLRIAKSESATAPYVYFKTGGGEWPGTAMTAEGDYWVYTSDTASSAEVIFNGGMGSWQDPAEDQGWYEVSGYMEYSKANKTVTNFTETGSATASPDAKKANKAPEFSISSTSTPASETPATEVPLGDIQVSKEDGSSFTSETMEVEINVGEGVNGSYIVDNGPVKTFIGKTTAVLGQGKIADSEVTLTVIAGTATKTFTYKKVFDKEVAAREQASGMVAMGNAVMKIQSLFEVVADVAEVNASLSNESLALQYATNAVGVGKSASITVDDSISDWSSDMLIAQGAANDDPRVYRPNSMYEVGIDTYALYGAYDSSNLYLMWEMTNVQDVVAPSDDYPLTQGTMYLNMNIPFFIAIDTGKDDVIGNKGQTSTGGTLWDSGITIDSAFNRIIAISTNGANGPYVYGGDSSGLNLTELYSKAGGGEANAGKSGIQFGFGTGILSNTVVGIDGGYGENNNRVVGDVCNDGAAWVDFNTKGHTSATMDYHYEMAIPLEELGISASDVESDGLGVLLIATSGKSGMDCLPYDVSMNDNADLDDSAGSQENNSFEKSDEDEITCSFARVGKGGDGVVIRTPRPATEPPASEIPASETPASETPASETPASETPATAVPDVATMIVNFGADKSSPQLPGTTLTLKAIGYNQTGDCTYEFSVDGEVVQAASANDSYAWNPVAGMHTIQVTMKDEAGKTVVIKKAYLIGDGSTIIETNTPASEVPTSEVPASEVPASETPASDVPASNVPASETPASDVPASDAPTPTSDTGSNNPIGTTDPTTTTNPTQAPDEMQVLLGFKQASPQKLGASIGLVANVTGGKAGYQYTYVAELASGFTQTIAKNSSKNTVTWKPTKTGTYTVTVTVTDANGLKAVNSAKYKITAAPKLAITKVTVSKKTVKLGKKIKITAKGTASKGTLKFKFTVKKNGQKKVTTIKKNNKTKTKTWKPKKAGKYTITIYATDGSKKTVKKTIKVTVKKK